MTQLFSETSGAYERQKTRICDLPARLRPREEMERFGAENISDRALLAVLLRHGVHGMSVLEVADGLLRHYGSLHGVARASIEDLATRPGMGRVKAQILKAATELAHRLAEEQAGERPQIRSPEDAARVLQSRALSREVEAFWVLMLDTKNRLVRPPMEISRGVLDASLVHPREVFREAIRASSAAVILMHNHPSGDPTPSSEDVRITKQLVQAGSIVDIKVLDHVIVGRASGKENPAYVSLRELGVVDFS
jgi:DNA repair protein RadC